MPDVETAPAHPRDRHMDLGGDGWCLDVQDSLSGSRGLRNKHGHVRDGHGRLGWQPGVGTRLREAIVLEGRDLGTVCLHEMAVAESLRASSPRDGTRLDSTLHFGSLGCCGPGCVQAPRRQSVDPRANQCGQNAPPFAPPLNPPRASQRGCLVSPIPPPTAHYFHHRLTRQIISAHIGSGEANAVDNPPPP